MANKQINELSELTSLESDDLLVVYDDSEGGSEKTKKITKDDFLAGLVPAPNMLINGGLQIWQEGSTFTSIASKVFVADMFNVSLGGGTTAVVDATKSTDAPAGFGSSIKVDCTTAETSIAAGEYANLVTGIEAQNLQHLDYGVAGAKSTVLSFWVKSDTKTGIMSGAAYQQDATRSYPFEITISDNNWNKYEVVIPGDTSGTIDDNNGMGIYLRLGLFNGSSSHGTKDVWQAGNFSGTSASVNFLLR